MNRDLYAHTFNLDDVDPHYGKLDYLRGEFRQMSCQYVMNDDRRLEWILAAQNRQRAPFGAPLTNRPVTLRVTIRSGRRASNEAFLCCAWERST